MSLKSGGDYGWPFCYYDSFQQKLVLAPEYDGDGGRNRHVRAEVRTGRCFPRALAPNALLRYDAKQFPARYRNGLFVAFHGSWNRAPYPQGGYNVVFQPMNGEKAAGNCEIFCRRICGSGEIT